MNDTPKKTKQEKKEVSLAFIILHDLFIFLSTLVFGAWLLIKLHNDMGTRWINMLKFAVTAFFGLLFLIKLIFFNRPGADIKKSKKIKFVFKIIKYVLKLLLLAIIIVGILEVFRADGISLDVIISAIAANFLFLVLLSFETAMLVRRHKKKKQEQLEANKNAD